MPIIIGQGGPHDRRALPLSTRKGNHIPNEIRPEAPPARMKAARDLVMKRFPNNEERSLTQIYNCMGLVFASRRSWIDIDSLPVILQDDEYHLVSDLKDARIGDLVVYGNGGNSGAAHIGMIVRKEPNLQKASWNIKVMSQWGADGEYLHAMEDVPTETFGAPMQFWTDRKVLS